jgi:serine acetyltransferase
MGGNEPLSLTECSWLKQLAFSCCSTEHLPLTSIVKEKSYRNLAIFYRFFYTCSISKMSKMCWADDAEKTRRFFEGTCELVNTAPGSIVVNNIPPMDIVLKVPAVIIAGQK